MRITELNELLPHRERMKLIDTILDVGDDFAVTESTVTARWPLVDAGAASTIVIVELVAQTASACVGWKRKRENPSLSRGRGWLVGIKEARFFTAAVPLNTRVTTRAETVFNFEGYTGIEGRVEVDGTLIGTVTLQVLEAENDSVLTENTTGRPPEAT